MGSVFRTPRVFAFFTFRIADKTVRNCRKRLFSSDSGRYHFSVVRSTSLLEFSSRRSPVVTLLPIMPQFVIEREIQGAGSLSESQSVKMFPTLFGDIGGMGPQIQWLHQLCD